MHESHLGPVSDNEILCRLVSRMSKFLLDELLLLCLSTLLILYVACVLLKLYMNVEWP